MPSLDVRIEILWRNPSAHGGHATIQNRKRFRAGNCGAAAETGKSKEAGRTSGSGPV